MNTNRKTYTCVTSNYDDKKFSIAPEFQLQDLLLEDLKSLINFCKKRNINKI